MKQRSLITENLVYLYSAHFNHLTKTEKKHVFKNGTILINQTEIFRYILLVVQTKRFPPYARFQTGSPVRLDRDDRRVICRNFPDISFTPNIWRDFHIFFIFHLKKKLCDKVSNTKFTVNTFEIFGKRFVFRSSKLRLKVLIHLGTLSTRNYRCRKARLFCIIFRAEMKFQWNNFFFALIPMF